MDKARFIRQCLSIAYYAGRRVGTLFRINRSGPWGESIWSILMYHDVPDDQAAMFRNQVNLLAKEAEPILISDSRPLSQKGKYLSVTFDDAFDNIFRNALPVLMDQGIPSTVFVPTGCLGQPPLWVDDLRVRKKVGPVAKADTIRKFVGPLVDYGSHTVSHLNLAEASRDNAISELKKSKKDLEELTGHPVSSLAFPYGEYTEETLDLAREAGYTQVLSAMPEAKRFIYENYCLLGRVAAAPTDTLLESRLKVADAYAWWPFASNLKQGLSRVIRFPCR